MRHVGLVLHPGTTSRRWELQASLDRLSHAVVDASLTLVGVGVVVDLVEFQSLSELFTAIDEALIDAEEGHEASPNAISSWCS